MTDTNINQDDVTPPALYFNRRKCLQASAAAPGVPLAHLLEAVGPMSNAKHVAFETLLDPTRMPGQLTDVLA